MYKQLKEDLLQTLMKNMGSVIDTLDEHSKSIKKLEQRISQLSAKSSDFKKKKDVESTLESATPENRGCFDAADGEYCKFLDSEHPGAYVIAILKSPYEKGKRSCVTLCWYTSRMVLSFFMCQTTLYRHHIVTVREVFVILSASMRLFIYEKHIKRQTLR